MAYYSSIFPDAATIYASPIKKKKQNQVQSSSSNKHQIRKKRMERIQEVYPLPKSCEYCGVANGDRCKSTCTRPKSFFQQRRPPFCPLGGPRWNPHTDQENPKVDLSAFVLREWDHSRPSVTSRQPTSIIDVSADWIASWWG
jgi:hypothetical protein